MELWRVVGVIGGCVCVCVWGGGEGMGRCQSSSPCGSQRIDQYFIFYFYSAIIRSRAHSLSPHMILHG